MKPPVIEYRHDSGISYEPWLSLFRDSDYNNWWTERNAEAALSYAHCVLTAWDKELAVGTLTVWSDAANFAVLDDLVVRPEYRGQGIGSELVKQALELIAPLEIHTVQLFPVPGRESFFERLGFEVQRGATVMDLMD